MKTLIIPCGGKSSRFPKMKPKWMLTHPDGQLMIEKAISGFELEQFDRIIVTIIKAHAEAYEGDIILDQLFDITKGSKVELLILDEFTSCQAETVYETLIRKNVHGDFVIKDSDNFVKSDEYFEGDFIIGLNIHDFQREIYRLKSKSFLVKNEQNIIVDIIEKQIKSENICLGVYGFSSVENFTDAYKILQANNVDKSEIYISHVVSYLIGMKQSVFKYIEAQDFEDWGTLQDWVTVQKNSATYFVDVDGVILENHGKYGKKNWSNCVNILENNMKVLSELQKNGAQIVITTSRDDSYKELLENILKQFNIYPHAILTNLNHASRIIINDFAPTNPYPSCKAISLPRNSDIADYLND